MRMFLAGLVLALMPGIASAECACSCVRGQSQPVCSADALVRPICQQVCVEKIEQSLGSSILAGGGGGGGGADPIGSTVGGIDRSTLTTSVGR